MKTKIVVELSKQAEQGCITADVWLYNSTMSYLNVTYHFIDENFIFHNREIELKYIEN